MSFNKMLCIKNVFNFCQKQRSYVKLLYAFVYLFTEINDYISFTTIKLKKFIPGINFKLQKYYSNDLRCYYKFKFFIFLFSCKSTTTTTKTS